MAGARSQTRKRRNQNPLDEDAGQSKRLRGSTVDESAGNVAVAGKIKKVVLRNFFCHDHLVMELNKNVNYIVGRNGSGKSAILTGITVGLGARAATTQRGDSFKSFIKTGKTTATIEITLTNEGPKAYEPEIFGNTIKVIRHITQTSTNITLKGQRDNVVSKKKSDLDKIVSALNIQVDNPISILNQKAAKTFLIKPSSSTLYALFMKATQLEIIGNNYKEALDVSKETHMKLKQTGEQLENDKREMKEIEAKIKAIENLQIERDECQALECEHRWARVIAQEAAVDTAEKVVHLKEKAVEDLIMQAEKDYVEKSKEIDTTIDKLSQKIVEMEEEALECEKSRDNIKREFDAKKEELSIKEKEQRSIKVSIKHTEKNIKELTEEINRLEAVSGRADREKAQLRERLTKLEEDLREIEGMVHTTTLDHTHVDSDKIRLENEERACRSEVARKEKLLNKLDGELRNLSHQTGNSLQVFGRNMPRLVKRIDEECKKGRFREKPRGPLGAFIKMRDSSWTPTVESFFGGTLHAFCVDNSSDAHLLSKIMKEIYDNTNERSPEIICSKFINRIHEVNANATRTDKYHNILDLMEISDPIVANCLIDQRSPESILLIPTNAEAVALLQNIENVPANCRRALTKKGDTYFPDPNFRTYGGRVQPIAKYLQVSTTEVIQHLNREIQNAQRDLNDSKQQLIAIRQQLSKSTAESHNLMSKITQLRNLHTKSNAKVEELRDKIADDDVAGDDRPHFINRRAEDQAKLAQDKIKEQQIDQQVEQLQHQVNEIGVKLNNCRQTVNGIDKKINPLKTRIRKLQEEKKQCQVLKQQTDIKLTKARASLQQAMTDAEIQKRAMETYMTEAEKYSTRIQTNRSPDTITSLIRNKKALIVSVEKKYGSKDELEEQLAQKKSKCRDIDEIFQALKVTNEEHMIRVQNRRKEWKDMRAEMGERVQTAFSSVLALRNYKGSLTIDYNDKTLVLDVTPQNTTQRQKNETMTLSGGERSYATVAFVLSLWECTALPFYFLDEFDVFMDKVNRRMIMEILLEHTKEHPQSQFGFLTPLDASIVRSDSFLTIHRLEPPNRT